MRIVVDLDGTICELRKPGQGYADVEPLPGAVERLRDLCEAGHTIIIHTARNMATCDANVGKVMRNVGWITLDWLERHGVPYDEIYFGKPNGDVYVDDRGVRFSSWEELDDVTLAAQARPH